MNPSEELTLRDFFSILRRRQRELFFWWGSVFLLVAVYTAFLKPQYRAQALLRLQPPEDMGRQSELGPLNVAGSPSEALNLEAMLSAQNARAALVDLRKIRPETPEREAAEEVGAFLERARIRAPERDPQLVYLSVVSQNGEEAARETNALAAAIVKQVGEDVAARTHKAKTFIETQLREVEGRLHESEDRLRHFQEKFGPQSAAGFLLGRVMELRAKQTQLRQKYTASHPDVRQVNAEIATLDQQMKKLPLQEVDMGRVSREIRLNEELFTLLMKRLEDARIMESARLAPVTLLEPAVEPARPERPNKPFNLGAGFVLGLLISIAVVWVRHQLDTSLLTTQDIQAILQLPVLAMVPRIERRQKPEKPLPGAVSRKPDPLGQWRSRLIVHFRPKSPCVEVYHILRTNLPKEAENGLGRVLMFTSAVGGEGKSLTAANFSIAAAQAGITTLLVEADFRKPSVDKLFGIPQEPGLSNYFYVSPRWETCLIGGDQIQEHNPSFAKAVNTAGLANLRILSSGKLPANPVSLLNSERFDDLLTSMRRRFPLIVLDSPPVMLFADCTMLAPHVDGVILVYRFGRTDRDALKQSHHQLISAKANVLGVVVNDMMKGETTDYTSYYSDYEAAPEERP